MVHYVCRRTVNRVHVKYAGKAEIVSDKIYSINIKNVEYTGKYYYGQSDYDQNGNFRTTFTLYHEEPWAPGKLSNEGTFRSKDSMFDYVNEKVSQQAARQAEIEAHFRAQKVDKIKKIMNSHDPPKAVTNSTDMAGEVLKKIDKAVCENGGGSSLPDIDVIRQAVSDVVCGTGGSGDKAEALDVCMAEARDMASDTEIAVKKENGYSSTALQHTHYSSYVTPFLQREVDIRSLKNRTVASITGAVTSVGLCVAVLADGFIAGVFPTDVAAWIVVGSSLATAGFIALAKGRLQKQGQAVRYYEYGDVIEGKEYYSIKSLAKKTRHTETFIRKDLEEMHRAGFLPNLWFDYGGTMLVLTENAYSLCQQAEESIAMEMKEKQENMDVDANNFPDENIRWVLQEAEIYQEVIHHYTQDILDSNMRLQADHLEKTLGIIFARFRKSPCLTSGFRRLMDYYLPLTVKFLYTYADLEKTDMPSENAQQTKEQILKSFNTINRSFEKLYNDMYEDVALDISSDIDVMKSFMRQDGLAEGKAPPAYNVIHNAKSNGENKNE